MELHGLSLALVDTAGLRDTADEVEREGVARARGSVDAADLVLVVLDRSRPLSDEDEAVMTATAGRRRIVVVNKMDRPAAWEGDGLGLEAGHAPVLVSALSGDGLGALARRVADALEDAGGLRDTPRVTNVRHAHLLERARAGLVHAEGALAASGGTLPEEFLLTDLQDVAHCLQEVTGRRTRESLLAHIFERFCIGK
ncbi:MAG: GTPase [Vicinamibacterales bacterium]